MQSSFGHQSRRKMILNCRESKRTTQLIRGLEELIYEEGLQTSNVFSLKKRHLREDMIATHKAVNGDIGRKLSLKKTCGHTMKWTRGGSIFNWIRGSLMLEQ